MWTNFGRIYKEAVYEIVKCYLGAIVFFCFFIYFFIFLINRRYLCSNLREKKYYRRHMVSYKFCYFFSNKDKQKIKNHGFL